MRRGIRPAAQSGAAGLNRLPGVRAVTPKGAFYAFPNISRTGWKAKPLASALLQDAGVATSAALTSASMARVLAALLRQLVRKYRTRARTYLGLARAVRARRVELVTRSFSLSGNQGNHATPCFCRRRDRLLPIRPGRRCAPFASRLRRRQDRRPRTCRVPENQPDRADRELATAVEAAIKSIDARQGLLSSQKSRWRARSMMRRRSGSHGAIWNVRTSRHSRSGMDPKGAIRACAASSTTTRARIEPQGALSLSGGLRRASSGFRPRISGSTPLKEISFGDS